MTTTARPFLSGSFSPSLFSLRWLALFAGLLLLALGAVSAHAAAGDLDGDTDIDVDDIAIIQADLNTPAAGPGDPKDLDADGTITVLDARLAVLCCTRPLCATGNNPPSITSPATANAAENQTAVIDVQSTDPDGVDVEGTGLTYSLTGAVDDALFTIDANTGVLTFVAAPDFESPGDVGGDNVYDVEVTVTDSGALTDVQNLAVTVTDVPESPTITSDGGGPTAAVNAAENQTAVTDVNSTDPGGETEGGGGLTYSLTGAVDDALFTIDPNTGVLTFNAAPDFEVPGDVGGDNVYDVQVTVTSTSLLTDVQDIAVTVTDVNEAPEITSDGGLATAALNAAENQTAVTDVQSSDPEGDTEGSGLTYSLTGGADQGDFSIVPGTGVLTFSAAPDFDIPGDANMDNDYEVQVTVTDSGGLMDVQDITVTVTNVNEAPVKTAGGGGPAAFTEGLGPVAVDPAGTLSDPDSANLASATVTITNLLDAGLEFLAANTGGTSIVANYLAPTLTLTGSDTVANFQAVLQSVTYNNTSTTPDETNRTISCVVNDGALNSNTLMQTVTVTDVDAPPMITNDPIAYTTAANTVLKGGAAAMTTAVAFVEDGSNIPAKAVISDPEMAALTFSLNTGPTSGSATVSGAGNFLYTPNAGFVGADSFTYNVFDGTNTVSGTVNVTVSDTDGVTAGNQVIWYVENDATAGGDGTSSSPFDTLKDAESGGGASSAGDTIFVLEGDGTTTNQDAGIVLVDSQKLVGHAATTLVANGVTIQTPSPGSQPKIEHTAGDAIRVDATAGNVTGIKIRGVDLSATGGDALDITSTGANNVDVLFENSLVSGATGEGVDVNHGSSGLATVTVNNLSTFTAAGNAFDARTTSTGDLHIALTNNPGIRSTTGDAIHIDGSGGVGRPFVTALSGNSVHQSTGGMGLNVIATAFDAIPGGSFDQVNAGALAIGDVVGLNRVGGIGVQLVGGVEGNLLFSDLDIAATGGGLIAVGSGPAMPGSGFQLDITTGTIDALNGPAVDLDPLTAGVSLASVTSTNSPTTGISLTNLSGTFSAGGGSSITGAVGDSFVISGGTVSSTFQGNITHTNGSAAVRVQGGHSTGTVVFDTGTINVTNGTGLQFNEADGNYDFNGTTTLNGGDAGVDIESGSDGTFAFAAAVAITHAGAGPAFRINNSAATVDHNGTINDANGLAVDIATLLAGGSARFDGQVTASGAGIDINSAAGTVSFANADLTNTATVDIFNNTATITFTDLDLNQTAGATNALEVNQGTANVTVTLTGNGIRSATPNRLVNVIGRNGGTVSFSGAANLQGTGTNGGINISGSTAPNSVTFNSAVDLGTGVGTRILGGSVNMSGNVANTVVTFNSLDIFTSNIPGIVATGSGVLDTATLAGTVNIDTTGNGAAAIDLDGIVSNTIFDSAVCATNSNCVDLTSLAATSVTRLAGLGLTCSGGTCFNANAARTVEVTGAGNTIAATNAVGLSILGGTTIGANDVTFQSIASSGATNGIVLNNTGTTGDFTITGDAGAAQNASGGTIQNTTGDAISLTSTEDISIDQVAVSNTGRHGVSGLFVNNFTLTNSTFNLIGNANDENAFDFRAVAMSGNAAITGILNLTNVDVTDFHDTGLAVLNESGSATINVTNCDFDDNDDTNGTDAVFVESQGTAGITLNVTGGLFNDLEGDVVIFEGGGSGTNDVNIVNTRSTNGGGPDDFPNGGGIEVRVSNGRTVTFDIQGNDLRDQRGDPLILSAPVGAGGGNLEGRVGGPNPGDRNTFSGSTLGDGIQLTLEGPNSNFTILIQNNDIGVDNTGIGGPFNGLGDDGIQILHRDNAGTLNLTIEDNRFANTVSEAIRFFSDEDTAIGANNPTNNVRIVNNDFTNIDTDNNEFEIELRTSDTARACYHVAGNDNGAAGSPGTINFSIAGTSTGEVTQASTAALATANAGATIAGDVPSTGGACTNPTLPMN